MNTGLILLVVTVFTALIFDFLNGFHDAANSIATVVSTRVLSPKLAVVWAAALQLSRRFFPWYRCRQDDWYGDDPARYRYPVCRFGRPGWSHLLGRVTWLLGTAHIFLACSYRRLRRSRDGARRCCMDGGSAGVIIASGWTKTLIFIVVAPVMGFVSGFGLMIAVYWIFQRRSPRRWTNLFRKLQLLSAAAYSLGHGGNDAQKTMGIVAGALYTAGVMTQGRLRRQLGTLALAHHPRRPYWPSRWARISAAGASCTPWVRRSPS